MRKEIIEIIEIPSGINIEINGNIVRASKDGKESIKKVFCEVKKQDNKLIVECAKATKKDKKLIKSTSAHLRNMIKGLEKKYLYRLQICAVHFPMNVSIKGDEVIIKNYLGEVRDRKAKILPGVEVKIDKEIINVESHDKEKAGQTAANIENATRICNRDRRVFQDGVYITSKEKGVGKK